MFAFTDDGGGVMCGFEEIERSAAKGLEQALSKVEDALNEEPSVKVEAAGESGQGPEVTDMDPYRRFGENMYEAHVDRVEEKEIRQWQSAFPYYRVTGSGVNSQHIGGEQEFDEGIVMIPRPNVGDAMNVVAPSPPPKEMLRGNSQYSRPNATLKTPEKSFSNLVVIGKQYEIHTIAIEEEGEGVDEQQGALEEILALDCSGEDITADSSSSNSSSSNSKDIPISPNACHREEVVAALTEAVWPECVEAMRPLIQRVVRVSRENNVVYEEENVKIGEGEGEEFMAVDVTRGRANSFDADW